MFSKPLLLAAVLLLSRASCNRGSQDYKIKTRYNFHTLKVVDTADKSYRLDTIYRQNDAMLTNNYDDNGALTSQLSPDGSKTSYEKKENLWITIKTDSTGKIINKQTDFRNAVGKTDSFIIEENGFVKSAGKYIYDMNGHKTECRNYSSYGPPNPLKFSYLSRFNYKDSNLTSQAIISHDGIDTFLVVDPKTQEWNMVIEKFRAGQTLTYYDYFIDKPNTAQGGTDSKNLLKRAVEISMFGDTDLVNNYRYTFDNKARVITEVFESDPHYKYGSSIQLEYDSSAYTYY